MRYSGSTSRSREEMLHAIGVGGLEELYDSIPKDVRLDRPLDIDGPLPEAELLARLDAMKAETPRISLVGGGLYHHYIPSTAASLLNRSEWITSYTPYQPETSQGTLVMYYEFQTYLAMLTGQEIANGGMYDGSTALAEAVMMAMRLRKGARVLYLSEGVHPEYREVVRNYLAFQDVEIRILPVDRETGRTVIDVPDEDQRDAIAVALQSPNFFGVIEDAAGLDPEAFTIGVVNEAQSLAILPPLDADIMVGESQSLGIPVQLGGPTAGFFATKKAHVRQVPGRLVGRSVDRDGREAFCITLATREQFIRREKATSNICTSSGLMCLRVVLYLSIMGRAGLQDVARKSARAARAFARGMKELGLPTRFSGATFNEVVIDCSTRPDLPRELEARGIAFGIPLDRWYPDLPHQRLCALTELHYPRIDAILKEVSDLAK